MKKRWRKKERERESGIEDIVLPWQQRATNFVSRTTRAFTAMQDSSTLLLALPDECLVRIMAVAPATPALLATVGRACHRLHRVCDENALWRVAIVYMYTASRGHSLMALPDSGDRDRPASWKALARYVATAAVRVTTKSCCLRNCCGYNERTGVISFDFACRTWPPFVTRLRSMITAKQVARWILAHTTSPPRLNDVWLVRQQSGATDGVSGSDRLVPVRLIHAYSTDPALPQGRNCRPWWWTDYLGHTDRETADTPLIHITVVTIRRVGPAQDGDATPPTLRLPSCVVDHFSRPLCNDQASHAPQSTWYTASRRGLVHMRDCACRRSVS